MRCRHLSQTFIVGFLILTLGPAVPLAFAGLNDVNVFISTVYNQTTSAAPTTPSNYFFGMGGHFQNAADFNSASGSFPGPDSRNIPIQGTTANYNSPFFPTLSALHATFPFGTYTITANNSNTSATQSGVINYTVDPFPGTIPALDPATFNALNGLNPSLPFDMFFNSHTANAATNEGFASLRIFVGGTSNAVFSTGNIPPNTTSRTIPAGTLLPDKAYRAELSFSDWIYGFDSANGVFTFQGFDVRTEIPFSTGPVPEPGTTGLSMLGFLSILSRTMRRRNACC